MPSWKNPIAVLAIGAGVFPFAARAYVTPSFFVVRSLAHKHANIGYGTQFESKVTVYKDSGDVEFSLFETMNVTGPSSVFVRLLDGTGAEVDSKTRMVVGDPHGDMGRPPLYDLLLVKDEPSIFEHFKRLGLPLKNENELYLEKEGSLPYKPEASLAFVRYESRVALTIGPEIQKRGESAAPRSPQLWVEKDSNLPLRAYFPYPAESGTSWLPLDYRFADYRVFKSFLFPRIIQVFRDGKLWIKLETLNIKAVAGANERPRQAGRSTDSDLKDFAATYFKWIR